MHDCVKEKRKKEELHFLLVRPSLLTKMLGEIVGTSCGLGSGVGDYLSKGSGLWGTDKTTNIFCAFQLCQGQAMTLPFSL